ncbi:MAG TPA: hypothetical protein VFW09_15365 [Solirubrobacteraceae bacterium]|nr:hypothetical protein [Solirubrobacteraceae bacterium]
MRARLPRILLAMVATLGCWSAVAHARRAHAHNGPTRAQIHKALARARHSKLLWATVNVCQLKGRHAARGGSIGVRGQMPTLGFTSTLSMTIQLNRWSTKSKSFTPLRYRTAKTTVSPGRFANNLHQDGAVFPFGGPAGLLNATVTFSWARRGKVLGTATRTTTGGHHDAAGGHPPHYSAAQCRLD